MTSKYDVSQKLNALVKSVTDLSRHVEDTEECHKEGGASLTPSPIHLSSQKEG